MIRKQIVISLTLMVSACGGGSPEPAAEIVEKAAASTSVVSISTEPSASYDEALAAALAAIDIAAQRGHAWSTSDQLVKDAAKAAAEGNVTRAISLADEARNHAELAAIQADEEAKVWREKVISE